MKLLDSKIAAIGFGDKNSNFLPTSLTAAVELVRNNVQLAS